MTIDSLIRPHIRTFQPYKSARSEVRDATVLLDANELSLGSPVAFEGVALNRYPDPNQERLRETLSARLHLPASMVFAGVGSDEIIDLLIRLTCEPGREEILVVEPTYGVYRVAAEFNNVRIRTVGLTESFDLDASQVLNAASPATKIVFCCSPNNPTGNLLSRDEISALCRSFSGLVVVDQAYVEFAVDGSSMADDVEWYGNLVVLRTLSKAWGLAGIRLGYCVADSTLISYLQRVKAPYNVNAVSASLAISALKNETFFRETVREVRSERERVRGVLGRLPAVLRVYPGEANFLLVEFKNAAAVYDKLKAGGIIVRQRHEPRLRNCLRISIGTQEENDLLLSTITECS